MKKIVLVFITAVLTHTAIGQDEEFDQLITELEKLAFIDRDQLYQTGDKALQVSADDPVKQSMVYIEYANHHYYSGDLATSDSLFQIAENLANKGSNRHVINKIKHRRNVLLSEMGHHREAERRLRSMLSELRRQEDKENLLYVNNALAQIKVDHDVQRDSGLYYYNRALKLAREMNSDYHEAFLINNIALLKIDMGKEDEALADFKAALEEVSKTDRDRLKAHILNNIGLIYMRRDEWDKAEEYFRKIMSYSQEYGAMKEMGIAYLNLGTIYFQRKDYETSRTLYDSALHILEKTHSVVLIPRAIITISQNSLYQGNYDEALRLADSSAHLASKYELLRDLILAHGLKARIYDSLGDLRSAIKHHKMVKELSDSSHQLEYDKRVAEMSAKYDVQEKEYALEQERAKNEILEKKREIDRIQRNTIIAIGGIAVLLIALIMYLRHIRITRRRQREYSQRLLNSVENERNRIAKELHDDIGQQLSMVMNRIGMDKEGNVVNSALQDVVESTRRIARNLYPSYLRKVELKGALIALMDRTEESTNLTCLHELDVDDIRFTDSEKLHVYRIVQECVSNTLKHSNATAIKLSFQSNRGKLNLTYRDNGRGIKKKPDLTGIGMMSINERVRILGGDLDISRGKGFRLNVTFESHENSDSR